MLSWIATRIFYAVVFFMLGAWLGWLRNRPIFAR